MGTEQSRARINAYSYVMKHLLEGIPDEEWKWQEEITLRRSRALYIGIGLTVLVLLVVGVIAAISPRHAVAKNELVLSRDSGQMYVQKENRLHPVAGLAAARLVLGNAAKPTVVTDADIKEIPQGIPIGIAQGPRSLPDNAGRLGDPGGTWAMCDYAEPTTDRFFKVRSTMLVASTEKSGLDTLQKTTVLAVHTDDVWILSEGQRRRVLGVKRQEALDHGARMVSAALLNSLVELPQTRLRNWPVDRGATSLCAVWRVEKGSGEPRLSLRSGNLNDLWRQATDLAQQDNDGDKVDAFLLIGRRAVLGYAAPLVGGGTVDSPVDREEADQSEQVDLWLVGDDGIRYGTQRDMLEVLGVGTEVMPVPWAMIAELSAGPYLVSAS